MARIPGLSIHLFFQDHEITKDPHFNLDFETTSKTPGVTRSISSAFQDKRQKRR